MDWDKLRIFHAAASAGSFTHAADTLNLSQSAVSRQVSALELDLKVPLFHRHARGLVLTEQGEMLFSTSQNMFVQLEATKLKLTDSKTRPSGELKITTTYGLGTRWLTPRMGEFTDLYPDIRLNLILTNDELDLSMREADVGLRIRPPSQPDLIQRKLFTIHFHAYASAAYLKRFGTPRTAQDLDGHRLLAYGARGSSYMTDVSWLATSGRPAHDPRTYTMTHNNILALVKAVESGIGIAVLPDYLISEGTGLTRILPSETMPTLDTFFVYPQELKNVNRIQLFRDFLVTKAQKWTG